jgi:hypothetical protein
MRRRETASAEAASPVRIADIAAKPCQENIRRLMCGEQSENRSVVAQTIQLEISNALRFFQEALSNPREYLGHECNAEYRFKFRSKVVWKILPVIINIGTGRINIFNMIDRLGLE